MKKKSFVFAILCSLGFGVSMLSAQTLDKPQTDKVTDQKAKTGKQPKKTLKTVVTAKAMETPEQLCGSNAVINSRVETCNETTTEICRRRIANCSNATGGGHYESSGVCTDCVPKVETTTPETNSVN